VCIKTASSSCVCYRQVLSVMPTLQHLNLSSNSIPGALSCGLALPSLRSLDLSHNALQGVVPPCILALKALEELYLSNNR
jgi:Leucine-rich repeat (LRR) protein